jgi:DNA polymerase elongation subunit (family B)
MNTFYGEAGNSLSPFYNVLVAASVTKKGQELIKFANAFVGARGWQTKYGDTDSLYISAPEILLQPMRDGEGEN